MKIYIKYMVSLRCRLAVIAALDDLGLRYGEVVLGEAELRDKPSERDREALKEVLRRSGLELMDDRKAILVDRITQVVVEVVHYAEDPIECNFSEHLTAKLKLDYHYMANIFREVKGVTIGQFLLAHRIERAKELMLYDEMNMTEIAYKLHFSSVAHLSNQFKKETGLTPSSFKKLKKRRVQFLELLGSSAGSIGHHRG